MKALKTTLLVNAAFSLLSGLALILFTSFIAEWLGTGNTFILLIIGIGLIAFEIMVTLVAFGNPINPKLVKSIIIQDWMWVIASAVIVVVKAFELTIAGHITISIVAIVVTVFAILQTKFLQKE